jgi:hypothetical protein
LQLAALFYALNYALYILELRNAGGLIINIIGAIVGGYGSAIQWVCLGGYMMKLFRVNKIEKEHQGRYLGIFNGLFYSGQMTGAVFTTFFLGLFSNNIYFIGLAAVALLSLLLCRFLLDPLKETHDFEQRMLGA